MIYILDSKGLLATLVLPNKIHAGGLIYDGTNVWITNGRTDYAGNATPSKDDKYVYYCDECGHIHASKQMPEK